MNSIMDYCTSHDNGYLKSYGIKVRVFMDVHQMRFSRNKYFISNWYQIKWWYFDNIVINRWIIQMHYVCKQCYDMEVDKWRVGILCIVCFFY